ncbi:MAG: hypothetical protein RXQ56_09525 [Thermoproteus sp.]|jgi:hypothetical protein|uniref:hypothetical protein n=1 Tax=Thermoproteus sp. CP80 TaxID=1650659 RepID=UPI001180DF97|nr:hypothetical protein [Thermoproteus sp. CP80]
MKRWEGLVYLVLALAGGEYIVLSGLLGAPRFLVGWALSNVFSVLNAPVPQDAFNYALDAIRPLCGSGYVGCEWDAYVAAHAMASAVWGIVATMVMMAITYVVSILLVIYGWREPGVGRLRFVASNVLAPLALLLVGYLICLYVLQPGNFILMLIVEVWRGGASNIVDIPIILGIIAIAIVASSLRR